jgi:hypothetical protein
MTTGITGQKICTLRRDEKCDVTWHHWAGKGYRSSVKNKRVPIRIAGAPHKTSRVKFRRQS